jgi:hypothetical protein
MSDRGGEQPAASLGATIKQHLVEAHDATGAFSKDRFFKSWFRQSGNSYYFLFRKNLAVTNLQFDELFALVRIHTSGVSSHEAHRLQFMSGAEFQALVQSLVDSFAGHDRKPDEYSAVIAEHYESVFARIVVTDCFWGSCAVYLPPHLELDLPAVCGESGYVHSCGRSVLSRDINKSDPELLVEALDRHLKRFPSTKRVFFAVYAHEDFTEYDRRLADELSHGLDEVKIYVEKYYMGGSSLVEVLSILSERFAGELRIPESGNYLESHRGSRQDDDEIDQDRTIWLVTDRGISDFSPQPSGEKFFICYDQLYKNDNPTHLFDENMPAWVAHTTIPHTLAGAMLNITRPHWPDGDVVVCDPFVGSGTVLLQALRYQNVKPVCSDKMSSASQLVEDNYGFFLYDAKAIFTKKRQLEAILRHITDENETPGILESDATEVDRAYTKARELVSTFEGSADWDTDLAAAGASLNTLERLFVYIALRASRRNQLGIARRSKDWAAAFAKEAKALAIQMDDLVALKSREEAYVRSVRKDASFKILDAGSGYSLSCATFIPRVHPKEFVSVLDVLQDELPDADVIVADPPYGFNTDEDLSLLAQTYAVALEKMVRALRHGGQLMLCLADQSRTGRETVYFTHKEVITHQVLAIADRYDVEVLDDKETSPHKSPLLTGPYYWESERALRRAVLHFRLRPLTDQVASGK